MKRRNVLSLSAGLPAAVLAVAVAGNARAEPIGITSVGGTSTESLGAFTGVVEFNADGFAGGADLAFTLTNTSPASNGGYITGFVFNLADDPDGSLSLSYVKQDAADKFKSVSNASASPFGTFEFGAALGGDWLGAGSPLAGVGVGQTRTFLFELAGASDGSHGLTSSSFITNNLPGGTVYPLAVRFKGFNDDGSDKVVGGDVPPPQVVPIPAAAWGGTMLLGALGVGRAIRRRREMQE